MYLSMLSHSVLPVESKYRMWPCVVEATIVISDVVRGI